MANEASLALKALNDLLSRQKDAIRNGDLTALSLLAEPMAEYLDQLTRHPAESGTASLEALKQQAEDNRRLLDAALKGVQAAAGRFREISGAASELRTYDSRGKSSLVSFAPGIVQRHA